MWESEQKPAAELWAPPCRKCNSHEVRRLKRELFDRIFSLQNYQCSRCKGRQRGFKREWWVIPKVLLVVAVGWGGFYVSQNPLPFSLSGGRVSPTSEAESLARARAAMGGQLSTFEQLMTKKPRQTLDNATILKLWRANVGTNVILQMIRTSNGEYDVSAGAIIVLREAQVDQSIILAMIDANYSAR